MVLLPVYLAVVQTLCGSVKVGDSLRIFKMIAAEVNKSIPASASYYQGLSRITSW